MMTRVVIETVLIVWIGVINYIADSTLTVHAESAGKAQLSFVVAQTICKQAHTFAKFNRVQNAVKEKPKSSKEKQEMPCKVIKWALCNSKSCSKFKVNPCLKEDSYKTPDKYAKNMEKSNPSQDTMLPSPRLTPGYKVDRNEFPWLVRLVDTTTHFTVCSGAIVSEEHVVTSASCLNGIPSTNLVIIAGDVNAYIEDSTEQIRSPKSVFFHPKYNCLTRESDVAVVTTSKPFNFKKDNGTQKLNLPPNNARLDADNFTLAGWGSYNLFCRAYQVSAMSFAPVDMKNCKTLYEKSHFRHLDDKVCALGTFQNLSVVRNYDEGAPLVHNISEIYDDAIMVGICLTQHFGEQSLGTPSVFLSVFPVLDFILSVLNGTFKNQSDPGNKHFFNNNFSNKNANAWSESKNEKSNIRALYQARIVDPLNKRTMCAGAILSPFDVITTASCVQDRALWDIHVYAGENNIYKPDSRAQMREASVVYTHRCFQSATKQGNIAIIKLETPFNFSKTINSIVVAPPDFQATGDAVLTGWGNKDGKYYYSHLQATQNSILPDHECKKHFDPNFHLVDDMLCTGPSSIQGANSCQANPGSPLALSDQLEQNPSSNSVPNKLVGIALTDFNCCHFSAPFLFVEISQYHDWVNATIYHPPVETDEDSEEEHENDKNQRTPNARNKKRTRNSLRVNFGYEAKKYQFPFQIRVVNTRTQITPCAGALIAFNIVITAAQCVVNATGNEIAVIAGEHDVTLAERREQERYAKKIILHPEFQESTLKSDIALLVLANPFINTRAVNTISILPQGLTETIVMKNLAYVGVTGWGVGNSYEKSCRSPTLRRNLFFNLSNCADLGKPFSYPLNDNHICTLVDSLDFAQGPCDGDTGVPLTMELIGGSRVLIGIHSFGFSCTDAFPVIPSVYTDVTKLTEFIQDALQQNPV